MSDSILITGASGFLGRVLVRRAIERDSVSTVYAGHCRNRNPIPRIEGVEAIELDLAADASKLENCIHACAPNIIIHAAAANPGSPTTTMRRINTEGTYRVATTAATLGVRLVVVSTDVVHDGRNAPYLDADPPTATDPYGVSKAEAEHAAQTACPEVAVIRPSLIYGVDRSQAPDRITDRFAERLRAGESVQLFSDAVRQPVWVESLANALLKLAFEEASFSGILNIVGDQALTREAFGRRMLDWFEIPGRERVEAIRAAELDQPPPLDLRLENETAKQILGIALPGVDEVLQMERSRMEKS